MALSILIKAFYDVLDETTDDDWACLLAALPGYLCLHCIELGWNTWRGDGEGWCDYCGPLLNQISSHKDWKKERLSHPLMKRVVGEWKAWVKKQVEEVEFDVKLLPFHADWATALRESVRTPFLGGDEKKRTLQWNVHSISMLHDVYTVINREREARGVALLSIPDFVETWERKKAREWGPRMEVRTENEKEEVEKEEVDANEEDVDETREMEEGENA